jgi:hypothetical protein
MDFLFEIRLRQEAAKKYNPVTQTKKFERIVRRKMRRKNFSYLKPNEITKSDVYKIEGMLAPLLS